MGILDAADAAGSDRRRRAHRALEARTGVEVVTAVVGKCDGYPEIVWKAFALGASLAALVVIALDVVRPDWATSDVDVVQRVADPRARAR